MPNQHNHYRERALKLYPWICGHCGREFDGKQLKELTVHHKDHNHDNNPADGSNWELLCIYCHDHEHSKYADARLQSPSRQSTVDTTYQPFADLAKMLQEKSE